MKRITPFLFVLLLAIVAPARGQQTTISDTIRDGSGRLANGTMFITPSQQFTTSGGVVVYPISTPVQIRNGAFTTKLYPNDATSSPPSSGCPAICTYYTVRFALVGQSNPNPPETWLVPTGGTVNLIAVRLSPTPLPSPTVALSQVTSGGGIAGQCPVLNMALIWVPGSCGAGGGGAPTGATYLTRQSEAGLSANFNMGSLASGLLKQTVAAGVATPAIATAGTDYVLPSGSITGNAATSSALDHGPASCPAGQVANGASASIVFNCIILTAAQVTNAFDKSASNTIATGTQDFSGAAHTLPIIVVANVGALPATGCKPGELAIVTAATVGQQIYENSGTGACVWTQQSGGGGGGTITSLNSDATAVQTLTRTNDTNLTVTIVDNGSGDHKLNLGWQSTLAAGRLNANVVQAITNDTNVTGAISAQVLTLGWTGTLAKARQNATTVYTDQAETYGAFLQDFSAATLKVPNSAALACATSALICYDTTANLFHGGVNGTSRIFANLKGSFSDGDFSHYESSDGLLVTANLNQNADGSLNASRALTTATPLALTYTSGGNTNWDLSQSNTATVTASGGNTTLVVTNPHGAGPYTLKFVQDSTVRTVTYPGTFQNFCNLALAAASSTTTITFLYDGTTNYYQTSCASTTPGITLPGATSGSLNIISAAIAGTNSKLTLPGGTTDFSATGGTSQVVKQTSVGGALTVARLACADLSDSGAGCTGSGGSTYSASQGKLSNVTQTGSDVVLYSQASVPALAAGSCYAIGFSLLNGTPGTIAAKLYVAGSAVATLITGNGSTNDLLNYQFLYCNNAGVQNAQNITLINGWYCASSCPANATLTMYSFGGGALITPTAVDWSTSHTVAIETNGASGPITPETFRIGQ